MLAPQTYTRTFIHVATSTSSCLLQKPIPYKQESGGRMYLNRRDPNDLSKGMNHYAGGFDREWYIKAEEEYLRYPRLCPDNCASILAFTKFHVL